MHIYALHLSPCTMQGLLKGKQASMTGGPWLQGAYLLAGKTRHMNERQNKWY